MADNKYHCEESVVRHIQHYFDIFRHNNRGYSNEIITVPRDE